MNDKEILIALSQGNPDAFEMIYNRFYGKIFFIAREYLHYEEDVKDIRSGCFIKLWELRDSLKFETMGALYGWLRSTTINACIDYLRMLSHRESKQYRVLQDYIIDHQEEIHEISDKEAIVVERLLRRLESLHPKFSTVFKMRCFEELKFIEIAERLHADLSTVKKRYARAVKLMKMIQIFV